MDYWGVLAELGQFVLPIAASVLTVVLAALAKKLLDKWGLERSEKVDNMIDRYVGTSVEFAERFATKKLDGRVVDGKDKLALATRTVLAELKQSGIKDVGEELIKARIEAWLSAKEVDSKPKAL